MIEKYFFTWDEHGVSYRLRPNPDVDCGFSGGAYLGWKNRDESEDTYTKREFFIAPEVMQEVGEMFLLAAKDANDGQI